MPEANSTQSNNAAPPQQGSPAANTGGIPGGHAVSSTPVTAPPVPAAVQPPAPAPVQSPSPGPGPNFGEVLTAIQSMPEQIVRALREATQPPRSTSGGGGSGDSSQDTGSGSQRGSQGDSAVSTRMPGRKSLAERWFG